MWIHSFCIFLYRGIGFIQVTISRVQWLDSALETLGGFVFFFSYKWVVFSSTFEIEPVT